MWGVLGKLNWGGGGGGQHAAPTKVRAMSRPFPRAATDLLVHSYHWHPLTVKDGGGLAPLLEGGRSYRPDVQRDGGQSRLGILIHDTQTVAPLLFGFQICVLHFKAVDATPDDKLVLVFGKPFRHPKVNLDLLFLKLVGVHGVFLRGPIQDQPFLALIWTLCYME